MMLAKCGLDCENCEARVATIKDDQGLREEAAKKWSKDFGGNLTPEMINCTGCNVDDGVFFSHCKNCAIKACAEEKSLDNCGECDSYKTCDKLSDFMKMPDVKERLDKVSEDRA